MSPANYIVWPDENCRSRKVPLLCFMIPLHFQTLKFALQARKRTEKLEAVIELLKLMKALLNALLGSNGISKLL